MRNVIFLIVMVFLAGCSGYKIVKVTDDFVNKTFFQAEIHHYCEDHGYVIGYYQRSCDKGVFSPFKINFKFGAGGGMNTLKNICQIIIDGKKYSVMLTNTKSEKTTWLQTTYILSTAHPESKREYATFSYETTLKFTEEMMKGISNAEEYKIRFNFNDDYNITVVCDSKELKAIKELANLKTEAPEKRPLEKTFNYFE